MILSNNMIPMIKPLSPADWNEQIEQSSNLQNLRQLLQLNLLTQDKLKKLRKDVSCRMQALEEYVATYRLRTEFPPASAIISYIKFERNTVLSYRHQTMLHDNNDPSKHLPEESEFMKKLEERQPPRKRTDINLAELPKDPKTINFLQLTHNSNYKCAVDLYRAWRDSHKTKPAKRPYTAEEDRRLIEKKNIYGDNWEKICQYMENRTFEEIYYEYHNRINPSLSTGKWPPRQSMMLIVLLEHYGAKKWAQIAHKMRCRSELQVRERFCSLIDPTITRDSWTKQMEDTLMEIASDYNYSWNTIAKLPAFKHKSDNCLWRKFRAIMAKKTREEIKAALPSTAKRDLAARVLKYKDTVEARKKSNAAIREMRPRVPLAFRPSLEFMQKLNPASSNQPAVAPANHQKPPQPAQQDEMRAQSYSGEMVSQQPSYILYP